MLEARWAVGETWKEWRRLEGTAGYMVIHRVYPLDDDVEDNHVQEEHIGVHQSNETARVPIPVASLICWFCDFIEENWICNGLPL